MSTGGWESSKEDPESVSVLTSVHFGAALVFFDQLSKMVIGVRAPHILNSGFVFGLGEVASSWVFLGVLAVMISDSRRRGFRYPETMIIAGGIGNVVDRLTRGAVLDWIHVGSMWFNLGDVWITLGVGWILLSFMKTMRFW